MALSKKELESLYFEADSKRQRLQTLGEQLGQLTFQRQECELVLDEFEFLGDTDVVYKQVGPSLIKQDLESSRQTVKDRIMLIETQMNTLNGTIEETRQAIQAIETRLQSVQA